MNATIPNIVFLIPIVALVAVFSFVSVAVWSEARRKEREAYYKSETIKRITEAPGPSATAALEYLREQEKNAADRRRQTEKEGQKLGGMVTLGVGIGLMVFLRAIVHDEPAYLVGLIPGLIGVALLAYSYFLAPKD